MSSLLIVNIGGLITGDLADPHSAATSIYIENGVIAEIDSRRDDADTVIDTPKEVRRFKVFATGSGIPNNAVYIGTTLDNLKPEAFHVYELVD